MSFRRDKIQSKIRTGCQSKRLARSTKWIEQIVDILGLFDPYWERVELMETGLFERAGLLKNAEQLRDLYKQYTVEQEANMDVWAGFRVRWTRCLWVWIREEVVKSESADSNGFCVRIIDCPATN